MNSPLEIFFKLGEKATRGDPIRKADFDYYFFWIIFIAFFGVFLGNIIEFYNYQKLANLGWALFGAAIMWFQYFSLKQIYEFRKMLKENKTETKEITAEDMLKSFDLSEETKKIFDEELKK